MILLSQHVAASQRAREIPQRLRLLSNSVSSFNVDDDFGEPVGHLRNLIQPRRRSISRVHLMHCNDSAIAYPDRTSILVKH